MDQPRRYADLGEFLTLLERRNVLQSIDVEVSPDQELAAIVDRVVGSDGHGPALLFRKVAGHPWPLVTNLFGAPQRSAWALGAAEPFDISRRLATDLAEAGDGSAAQRLTRLAQAPTISAAGDAPCRAVTVRESVDLSRVPLIKNFPRDGGSYLTLPLVVTADPRGTLNCGIYRAQQVGPDRLAIHWHAGSDGARNFEEYRRRNEAMPIAIVLGGDPSLYFSAAFRLPPHLDEYAFAGYLRDEPLELIPCLEHDLCVPGRSELVLEGWIDPGCSQIEGPFGNHTGYYQPPRDCPVMRVTTLTRRQAPVVPATVVGCPPTENCFLAKGLERLLLPLLQVDLPAVRELSMPLEGIFHGCACVAAAVDTDAAAWQLLEELNASPWLGTSRFLLLCNEEVDVHDGSAVLWRLLNAAELSRDVKTSGATILINATGVARRNEECHRDPRVLDLVDRRWREYGLERR